MSTHSLLRRMNAYQLERFPVAVLMLTTLAVVLSSSAVLGVPFHPFHTAAAVLLVLLALFHIRVIDEYRDLGHDAAYHAERPIQRGNITLHELSGIDAAGLVLFAFLAGVSGLPAVVLGVGTLGFSYLAGKEFFLGQRLRDNFYLYNAANLLQMCWLQFLIYAVLDPHFSFQSGMLWTHFAFAFTNSVVIEIVRKIRLPEQESRGKDTYSWHAGFGGSIALLLAVAGVNYALFLLNVRLIGRPGLWSLILAEAAFASMISAGIIHAAWVRKATEYLLLGASLLSYLTLHGALFLL